jgi:hypothetical protein
MWKSAALTLYDWFRISRVNENKKVLTICAAVLRYERHNHKGWHKFQNFQTTVSTQSLIKTVNN